MSQVKYSKHKDTSPQDTIYKIQGILNRMGLFPVLERTKDIAYKGVRSNRITLYPSRVGVNGKGTDELYATASGYAELMERIENVALPYHAGNFRLMGKPQDFFAAPDEKMMDIAEIAEGKNRFLQFVFDGLGLKMTATRRAFLERWCKYYGLADGTLPVIPFADMAEGGIVWLPPSLISLTQTTNGMAAGNTIEEAMVQGLSEVCERYVNLLLLHGKFAPPKIPDEYLQELSLWDFIEELREGGKYEIAVYDCSLGKGYPVVASFISDKNTGSFGLKFGSHPSFAVAVERTLTEAMQGYAQIAGYASANRFGSLAEASAFLNTQTVMADGHGLYPVDMFVKEPDYRFAPWKNRDGMSNGEMLKDLLATIKADGFEPYMRDASHLGFPACHIVIPGMSHIRCEPLLARLSGTILKMGEFIGRFPRLTPPEEDTLLKVILFSFGSVASIRAGFSLYSPIHGRRMDMGLVGGFLAFKRGEFAMAERFFRIAGDMEEDEETKTLLTARTEYVRYRAMGNTHEEAGRVLSHLFREDVAERVSGEMAEPGTVMEHMFPELKCPYCENCELAGKDCDSAELEVEHKILRAMKEQGVNVSQDALWKRLQEICG